MPSKTVNSILRSTEILKVLAEGSSRISDICKKLETSKSTVHRLLKTLEISGLVRQDPWTRQYGMGPLFIQLASASKREHEHLISCSIPHMRRLRDISCETINLQIPLGTERIVLEEIQSHESIKYVSGKGAVYPIFIGSTGKVLLSEYDDGDLAALLRRFYFVPTAPNPIKTASKLIREVNKARTQGYATSFGERIAGSASVSVPIKNYVCPVALTILGPAERFRTAEIKKVMKELTRNAKLISEELAFGISKIKP